MVVDILSKIKQGHKISGFSWGELCQDILDHQKLRVDTKRITKGRHSVIKTQINKHLFAYISDKVLVSEININSFLDYAQFRRINYPEVTDETIRNEHTTINSIFKFAHRNGYTPVSRVHVEEIRITEVSRRDAFTIHEFKVLQHDAHSWIRQTDGNDHPIVSTISTGHICISMITKDPRKISILTNSVWF